MSRTFFSETLNLQDRVFWEVQLDIKVLNMKAFCAASSCLYVDDLQVVVWDGIVSVRLRTRPGSQSHSLDRKHSNISETETVASQHHHVQHGLLWHAAGNQHLISWHWVLLSFVPPRTWAPSSRRCQCRRRVRGTTWTCSGTSWAASASTRSGSWSGCCHSSSGSRTRALATLRKFQSQSNFLTKSKIWRYVLWSWWLCTSRHLLRKRFIEIIWLFNCCLLV